MISRAMLMGTAGVCAVGIGAAFVTGRAFATRGAAPASQSPRVTVVATAAWRGTIGNRTFAGAPGRATYALDPASPCAVIESDQGVVWARLDTANDTLRPWSVGRLQTVCLMRER
jgi:hypothetical protein